MSSSPMNSETKSASDGGCVGMYAEAVKSENGSILMGMECPNTSFSSFLWLSCYVRAWT